MAKQRDPKPATTEAAQQSKAFESQLAGRLGLGVAVVRYELSQASPEALATLQQAFEQNSDRLAELFRGLRPSPKPSDTPEATKTE